MKFYLPEHEEKEDAREVPGSRESSPYFFVLNAAQYAHNQEDFWEATWPVVFVVIDNKGKEHRYSVDREYEPVFRPIKVKEEVN